MTYSKEFVNKLYRHLDTLKTQMVVITFEEVEQFEHFKIIRAYHGDDWGINGTAEDMYRKFIEGVFIMIDRKCYGDIRDLPKYLPYHKAISSNELFNQII